jgi:hypothetical protein
MSLQRQNNPPPAVGWRLNRREISVRGRDKRKETISGMKRKKEEKDSERHRGVVNID